RRPRSGGRPRARRGGRRGRAGGRRRRRRGRARTRRGGGGGYRWGSQRGGALPPERAAGGRGAPPRLGPSRGGRAGQGDAGAAEGGAAHGEHGAEEVGPLAHPEEAVMTLARVVEDVAGGRSRAVVVHEEPEAGGGQGEGDLDVGG